MIQQIELIELDDSFQIREETREEKIDQYAEYFLERNNWGDFPPIDVVLKDGRYVIADGIHRFRAAKRAGFEAVPCNVTEGGEDDWTLLQKSVEKNGVQGIDMGPKDWRKFRRMVMEKLSRGEIPAKPYSDIAKLCRCSVQTITRLRDEMTAEGWAFPESAVGSDGKERKTSYEKSTFPNGKVQPSTPPTFCANDDCGVPIWEENKGDPNYTYVEEGGKWFCSPECAEEYKGKSTPANAEVETEPEETPETWEPEPEPEEAFEPVKHEAKPEISEEEENQRIAEEIAETLKNFKALRKKEILIILINILNINSFFLARSSKNSELSEEEKTDFVWPLVDGTEWTASRSQVERWKKTYPAVDVEQQLRECIDWSYSNPRQRKTAKGIENHIRAWLQDKQNNPWKCRGNSTQGAPNTGGRKSHYVSRDAGLDFENLDYGP